MGGVEKLIPEFTANGLLPPFLGKANSPQGRSPYLSSVPELWGRFSYSDDRRRLLDGLVRYRSALHHLGFSDGMQIIDGSFLEDVETLQGRSPRDIDVVTFVKRPNGIKDDAKWIEFLEVNKDFFANEKAKEEFFCDAYFVDLDAGGSVVEQLFYWHGLFEHQRDSFAWKGAVALYLSPELGGDDG